MVDVLEIYMFGGFRVKRNGASITEFATRKARALFIYLAYTGQPHSREFLAELLWEERTQEQALGNLRVALHNLRQHLASYLVITPQTIGFDPDSKYWLDVIELNKGLQSISKEGPQGLSRTTAARLEETLALYKGDFLEGFYVRDSSGFEEWLTLERELLRQRVIEAYHGLIEYYLDHGFFAAGLTQARRLIQIDPWREEVHQQLMLLLAYTGQYSAALAQYDAYQRTLADELDAEPSERTISLYRQISSRDLPLPALSPLPHHNLPSQTTAFIGRANELAKVAEFLANPACRLLTLVGPGGIGKTRLALQAAQDQVGDFPDGVYFVALASVDAPQFVVSAIADALKLSFQGREEPKVQLLTHLRKRRVLLILDGFEHLLEEADFLGEILINTTHVKILATSRERLNLQGEWLLQLQGMAYPTRTQVDNVGDYSAVQLFLGCAERLQAQFSLAGNEAAIVRICQLVEGMPLGIELAASYLPAMSCLQIAEAIKRSLDALSSSMRNLPKRHRSLRAMFEHSWRLLGDEQRLVLIKVSVFRGSFTLEAAQYVAEAPASVLAALVEKSLIRTNFAGRFDMHELLRQYALEKLAESGQKEQIKNRHVDYYRQFAEDTETKLLGTGQLAALGQLEIEHDNVRAALEWSIDNCSDNGLRLAGAVWRFWQIRGHFTEGRAWLERVLACRSQQRSLPRAKALIGAGMLAILQGDIVQANALHEDALIMCQALGDKQTTSWLLNNCAIVESLQGNDKQALAYYEKGVALARELGNKGDIATFLINLGDHVGNQGDHQRAKSLFEESLMLSRELENRWLMAYALNNLGHVAQHHNNYEQAQAYFEESLLLFRELGVRRGIASSLTDLGDLILCQNNDAGASVLFKDGLRLWQELHDNHSIMRCLIGLAQIAAGSQPQRAALLFGAIEALSPALGRPSTSSHHAEYEPIASLRARLGEAAFETAFIRGRAMTLEQVVNYVLELE